MTDGSAVCCAEGIVDAENQGKEPPRRVGRRQDDLDHPELYQEQADPALIVI